MSLEDELLAFKAELKKLILLNNDLIDQLRQCQNENSENPSDLLDLRQKAILRTLEEQNFSEKIEKLMIKIKEKEVEVNGYSIMGRNSPFTI